MILWNIDESVTPLWAPFVSAVKYRIPSQALLLSSYIHLPICLIVPHRPRIDNPVYVPLDTASLLIFSPATSTELQRA